MLPIIIGLLLAVIPSLFLRPKEIVKTEVQHVIDTIIVERDSNGYSDEFMALLGRAEHIIDSMYQPYIDELNNGTSYVELSEDVVKMMRTCLTLLRGIQSPLLEDPKTRDEFVSAWEHLYADKYNTLSMLMYEQSQSIMNQHEPN